MTVTRDFDAMLAERSGDRPTFKVANQEFTVRNKLPYAKWNALIGVMRDDDTAPHDATVKFFDTVLIRADRQRFLDLLNDESDEDDDEENLIDMAQLDAITEWLMEHFTGKLQSNSGGSSPGAGATGQSPNVVSLQSRNTNA